MAVLQYWRKSSRSATETNCVEIGTAPDIVGIRDTKNRDGGTLRVTPADFAAFLTRIKTERLH
ncbi:MULTISPECIES: DUF397 domain-containing protein [Actinoalloteichus]|uniref:DUF397 family protein n=1 Tax=Actinoalloteichus fjordicus TaxID=1612552 RepID=A0AAC9PSN0_9PSEU|nr:MULTISPECIES: DUF397 domain-containing protein [Actinoalloteichus]APU15724.1 putative DUF397 family protein [Actinoalloteichus fjordicus]APU21784.1 putative DUF397 family protein [Actinoalloteichus sp. GBA129-24]